MFTLKINTDNAAFGELGAEKAAEVAMILRRVAGELEAGAARVRHKGRKLVSVEGQCRDTNGNTVGEWSLTVDGAAAPVDYKPRRACGHDECSELMPCPVHS